MSREHPFAPYVRILGKGPNLSRSLTAEEAETAMGMILRREAEPVQEGAFLCLLRVKTETPEEIAGFVRALRAEIQVPRGDAPPVALDWPSWAGKARQLPWYLLAAQLLAGSGITVFMHGAEDHTAGRLYASEALTALGVPVAASPADIAAQLRERHFAYAPLPVLSPRLQEIIDLKWLLGVRSPIHTAGRSLNPFDAPAQLLSVTHPPYLPIHQEAAALLNQPRLTVFKGDGGEAERRPGKPVDLFWRRDGEGGSDTWPALTAEPPPAHDEVLNVSRMRTLWRGEASDEAGRLAVIGTAAIALWTLGRADTPDAAHTAAEALWANRDTSRP